MVNAEKKHLTENSVLLEYVLFLITYFDSYCAYENIGLPEKGLLLILGRIKFDRQNTLMYC